MSTKIKELETQIARMNRRLTDAHYMMEHMAQMLGPKARQVIKLWTDQGIQRIHVSWGPDAANMSGEEIAQLHLDMVEAAKNGREMTREEMEQF